MKFIKWLFVSLLLVGWVAQFECNKMVTESEENGSDSVLMSRYVNLVSPAFGAIVHVATVLLVWNEIPNGEKIEVVVDNSNDFTSPEFSAMDIEDTTVTTTPLPPGVYYWRARLEDGDSSNVWMFIVSKNNSSAPNLLQPENGTAKFEDTFTFNWSFHLDALEYEIQIDTSNQFTDPIVHKTRLTTSNYSLDVPLEPETYFWRVRYHFPRDLMSAWSDPWWFLLKWVFDIDGNIYETVEIGNQIWMAENLRVRHYRNGDPISYVNSTTQWNDIRSEAYCDCDGNPIKSINYGHLYNLWAVFDARGLPPEGWHIPSDDEWKELEMFLGMSQASADDTGYRGTNEGGKLKEIGTAHWQSPNYGATNEYGFTALPAGMREGDGTFYFFGEYAHFWALNPTTDVPTVGDIWLRALASSSAKIRRDGTHFRTGYSVRCVKN